MLSATMVSSYRDGGSGIGIVNRTDEQFLNNLTTQAPTCLLTATVRDLLFAGGGARNTANVTEHGPFRRRPRQTWAGRQHGYNGGQALAVI
nr:unnamed protein product [Spirometra erinaceieuropaei]